MKVSVVIPVYNEQSTVEEVIRRVAAVPLRIEREIIVADDGSCDGTGAILKRLEAEGAIRVSTSPVNRGKGAAVRSALACASGDVILIQDADLELAPEEYPVLLRPLLDGQADVVYGSRFAGRLAGIRLITRLANKALVRLTNLLYGSRLTDMETAYKVFRTSLVRRIRLDANGFEFEPEVTAKLLRLGCRIAEVPISYRPRTATEGKKIGWKDGVTAVACLLKYRWAPVRTFMRDEGAGRLQ